MGLGTVGTDWLAVMPSSRASPLPHLDRVKPARTGRPLGRFAFAFAFAFAFDLGRPINHKGRTQALRSGQPGMDAGLAALGHG